MTAYIRSTLPVKSWTGRRQYVVTLSRRRCKRVRIGQTDNPLAAALIAARAELS